MSRTVYGLPVTKGAVLFVAAPMGTLKLIDRLCIALGFGFNFVLAEKVRLVNGVYQLEESNFEAALQKFPYLMVNFYAPYCGPCNGFAPKYEKAARNLKKVDMPAPRLAKVDVTVEQKLAKKWGVEVNISPEILVFKRGALFAKYNEENEKDAVLDYMSTINHPPVIGEVVRLFYFTRRRYMEFVAVFAPKRNLRIARALFPAVGFLVLIFSIGILQGFVFCCRCCCRCCCGCFKRRPQGTTETSTNDADGAAPTTKKEQ